jgi:hypothetical protein
VQPTVNQPCTNRVAVLCFIIGKAVELYAVVQGWYWIGDTFFGIVVFHDVRFGGGHAMKIMLILTGCLMETPTKHHIREIYLLRVIVVCDRKITSKF